MEFEKLIPIKGALRWGNPLYRWPVHEQSGFAWWRQRLEKALELYDAVRAP